MEGIIAIIPARIGSTRLPGKPLIKIGGIPLILHCYRGAIETGLFQDVVVATDSKDIVDVVEQQGGKAVLTDPRHGSGTDRVAEVARNMGIPGHAIIVNIQGDQPVVKASTVEKVIRFLESNPDIPMATPACPMESWEAQDPNRVKVVLTRRGLALYFSRALVPYPRDGGDFSGYLRHIGIYGYRNSFLQAFVRLPQGHLEEVEKLEQLRALEYGYPIGVVIVDEAPMDVDTKEDLERVNTLLGTAKGRS